VLGGDDVIGGSSTESDRSWIVRRDRGDEGGPVDDLDSRRVVERTRAQLGAEGDRCVEPHRRAPGVDDLGKAAGGHSTVSGGGRAVVVSRDREHGVHCAGPDGAVLEEHVEIAWCEVTGAQPRARTAYGGFTRRSRTNRPEPVELRAGWSSHAGVCGPPCVRNRPTDSVSRRTERSSTDADRW
jgi:hypothetical protein